MKPLITLLLVLSAVYSLSQEKLATVIQKGHSESVKKAIFSPDGAYIATASRDKSIKLWDAETGLEIRSLLGHQGTVTAIDFSPDGTMMASGAGDNTIRVWDISNGEKIWRSPTYENFLTSVKFSPNGKWLAYGGNDWHMTIVDTQSYDTLQTIKVNSVRGLGLGVDIQFSPDSRLMAVGQDDHTLKIYETGSWEEIFTFKKELGSCGGCLAWSSFHPDKPIVAKISRRGPFEIRNLQNGELITTIDREFDEVTALGFDSSGQHILLSTADAIHIFDWQSGEEKSTFSPEVKEINHAVWRPDDGAILIAGNDNKATIWSLQGEKQGEFAGILHQRDNGGLTYDPDNYWESYIARYIKYKNRVALSADGRKLLKGKVGNKVRMWDIPTGATVMEYIGHESAAIAQVLLEEQDLLVTGDGNGEVIMWQLSTGKQIRKLRGHRDPVFDLEISHDRTKIAGTSWDGTVYVWNLSSGEVISNIYFENVSAYNIAFSPNDVYLALGKLDKTLEIWEYTTKRKVKELIGHTGFVTQIRWDAEKELISTGSDGMVIRWDVGTELIKSKQTFEDSQYDVLYYGEDQLLTAGADRVIRLIDKATGKVHRELHGHQAAITSLSLDQTKGLLVSADIDDVIKVWKTDDWTEFFEHIQVGESDWMVRTTDGHFYATDRAIKNVHFVRGLQAYQLDQFFDEFYNPGLLPKLWEGEKKKEGTIQGLLEKSPPPELRFGSLADQDDEEATLYLRAVDTGGGIKDVQIFQNGKRLDPSAIGLQERKKEGTTSTYSFTAPLVSGHNVFTAIATSKGNIASKRASTELFSNAVTPGSTCHVLAIGINQYQNPNLNLNYAKDDAESFVQSIEEVGSELYADVKINRLYDRDATKEDILATLDRIAGEVQLNDVFILYYAGHGSVVDENFYFIPTEATRLYEGSALEKQAINALDLQEKLKKISALKQVIIMDACQSGQSVELLAERGALEEKAISQLSRSAGIHVMAAAGSEQFATEFVKIGHGLFTYLLLEALSGKADGAPKDGKITIFEIKSFLDDQVPEYSLKYKGKPQYPYSFSRGRDFPIGIKNE
jgi:WD40 repeat protein/uncharacterized caspase-like protein